MKKTIFFLTALAVSLFFASCEKESGKGTMKLSLTDSPVDSSTVSGVYITITGIDVNTAENGWVSIDNFDGPATYNLLDLTRGVSDLLGSIALEGGRYTQIRFMLEAPDKGGPVPSNPGCYIEFRDGTTTPLFVPSGAQTGYKATGEFTVPVNDTVRVMADFDVRKSVVKAGHSGKFILKPTIRLIVENQAGSIRGMVTNIPADSLIVIYAYADGTYNDQEAAEPATAETPRFPNAVCSDPVDEQGIYHLPYLAQGIYDLVVTSAAEGTFGRVISVIENIQVESLKTTTQDIDINSLK